MQRNAKNDSLPGFFSFLIFFYYSYWDIFFHVIATLVNLFSASIISSFNDTLIIALRRRDAQKNRIIYAVEKRPFIRMILYEIIKYYKRPDYMICFIIYETL